MVRVRMNNSRLFQYLLQLLLLRISPRALSVRGITVSIYLNASKYLRGITAFIVPYDITY